MRRTAAIILLAGWAGGCATTPALFAVVPGSDGHVGNIVVYACDGPKSIDTAYGAQRLGSDGFVIAEQLTAEQVRETFGTALAALPPKPATFTLYFPEGRDELTPESTAELDKVIQDLKSRPLPEIVLIGHTDTVGGAEYNDKLSYSRAERARELLLGMGLKGMRIDVAGRGKRELLVPTEDNVAEARNRRVEISVR